MALQLVIGGSGSGKSEYIYQDIIKKSMAYPENNYIVVVPEQYTMATQKKLVMSHPRKGILNIDVVSFERLAYKVFEEIGGENRPVLDDTGKNLIVRRVLESNKKQMHYFGSGIQKTGFVSELKSVISELLQYDIGLERLEQLQEQTADNRQLCAKLGDISVIYAAFKEYMSTNYITSEEILDVLCQVVEHSQNIKRSEIVFDGFTGFTPIQYKLLNLLFINCRDVQISVTIDANERLNVYEGMHNLFFMSKEMIQKLMRICDLSHIAVKNPVLLQSEQNPRYLTAEQTAEDLAFLEKNIFRYNKVFFKEEPQNIRIYAARTPKEELRFCIGEIIRLTRQEQYHYRDIAIVVSDIAAYGKLAGNICGQNDIPCFVDHKKSITDNPFVEFIRSALEMIERGYTYDSVLRYLRTGFTAVAREDIDLLDNYCVAVGIRGAKAWHEPWTKGGRGRNAYPLEHLNALRAQIIAPFTALETVFKDKQANVRQFVTAVYNFVVEMNAAATIEKLAALPDTGNEYDQLYGKVMELFDKLVELLGEEQVSVREFNRIVDAGFEEIKVGLIPPTADCVVIGDIERTRLDNIKVLFFVGVNEGNVPKKSENRSLLSEADRDALEGLQVTLSPSVREKAFVQRFYLYLILTKASQRLYITYAGKDNDGKSLLPSYLIRDIRQLFPAIVLQTEEQCAGQLSYIQIPKAEIAWDTESFIRTLSENVAVALYDGQLHGSVSAFETFASCKFAYFLQYGLGLCEREAYRFAVSDFGTVLHEVLENVSKTAAQQKKSLSLLTDEERRKMVAESIADIAKDYGDTILKENSRNEFLIKRMADLADRTLWAIGKQLASGTFTPDAYELHFLIDEQEIKLKELTGKMTVQGIIDRIDICEDHENLYVRIVDYKSGKSDFDLLRTYYGLKMQLITYMRAAMQIEGKRHPGKNIIPAGILYYNIDDPIIENAGADAAFVEEKIQEALRMQGVVNSSKTIVRRMDDIADKKSKVVPVSFKADGELDLYKSKTMSTAQFLELGKYVSLKSADMGREILSGDIAVNPYESGDYNSCKYCPYSAVCGFSPDMEKTGYRHIKKFDDERIWKNIKEGVDENGKQLDRETETGD